MFRAPIIANRFQIATQPAGRHTAGNTLFALQISWGGAKGAGAKPPENRVGSGRGDRIDLYQKLRRGQSRHDQQRRGRRRGIAQPGIAAGAIGGDGFG